MPRVRQLTGSLGSIIAIIAFQTASAAPRLQAPHIAYALPGETTRLASMQLAANGTFFVTASQSGAANIRSVATGGLNLTIPLLGSVAGAAISPDSASVFLLGEYDADTQCNVTKWSATSGTIIAPGPSLPSPSAIAISSDGKTLAVGAGDNKIYLLNATTLTQIGVLSGHKSPITSVAFAATSAGTLVSGDAAGAVFLWNTALNSGTSMPNKQTQQISAVAISPASADTLVSASYDGTVKILSASKKSVLATISDSAGTITSIAISSNGATLVTGDTGGSIIAWSLPGGVRQSSFALSMVGAADQILLPPNGTSAIVAEGTNLTLYSLATGKPLAQYNALHSLAHDIVTPPSGAEFAIAADEGVLRFAAGGQTQLRGIPCLTPIAYSIDGKLLACGNPFSVHSLVTNTTVRKFSGYVSSLAISAGGLDALTYDGANLDDFSAIDGSLQFAWPVATSPSPAAFTPDGAYMALWANGAVNVFATVDGSTIASISAPLNGSDFGTSIPGPVALSFDGSVAAYSNGQKIYVFSVLSSMSLAEFTPPPNVTYVSNVWALSPLGDQVAAAVLEPSGYTALYMFQVFNTSALFFNRQIGTGMSTLGYSFDGTLLYLGRSDGSVIAAYSPYGPALESLSVAPTTLQGGLDTATGVVALNAKSQKAINVALNVGDPNILKVPASVQIPIGATSATFTVTANAVSQTVQAPVYALHNGIVRTVMVTVEPATKVAAVTATPSTTIGGYDTLGTVQLAAKSPDAGLDVQVTSNSAAVIVPATVTVLPGKKNAHFLIVTAPVSAPVTAKISATHGGVTMTATVTVNPVTVALLQLLPASVVGGDDAIGLITLSAPAPTDTTVQISTSASALANPAVKSVTIPAGQQQAAFYLGTAKVTASKTATISAAANGATTSAVLTVTP